MYFTDVLWPDFNEKSLMDAIKWYSGRSRRFGGTEGETKK
jgi:undecaprenyl diphosphate synthase